MTKQHKYISVPTESPSKYEQMPDGLDGYWWETKHVICIPAVSSKHEGDGTFTTWLTGLEAKGKLIFFPTIISARLDSILTKRGYGLAITAEVDEFFGCRIAGLAKCCSQQV